MGTLVYSLEEIGGHLDGIQTRSARDLHKDENDAEALANMLQQHRKRILNAQ